MEIHASQSVAIFATLEILKLMGASLGSHSLKRFETSGIDTEAGDAEVCVTFRLPDGSGYLISVKLKRQDGKWKPIRALGWFNGSRDCDWEFSPDGQITPLEVRDLGDKEPMKLPVRIRNFTV